MKQKMLVAGAVVGVLVAVLALYFYSVDANSYPSLSHFDGHPIGGDFWQFWSSARLVLAGLPEGPYSPVMLSGALADMVRLNDGVMTNPLYYPPIWLVFLAPFGLLPFFPALLAFFAVGFGVFMAAIRAWTQDRRVWLLMLAFTGIWVNLVTGQNGLITAGLFGLGMALLPASPVAAGLCLGLISFKPQLCLLIPLALIAGREWQTLKVAFVTVMGLIGLTICLFGILIWFDSADAMTIAKETLGTQQKLLLRIPSFYSFVRLSGLDVLAHVTLFGPSWKTPGVAMLMQACFAAPVIYAVLWAWRRTDNIRLRASVLACGALLVTPFLYDYDNAWLVWPVLLLGLEAGRTRWHQAEIAVLPLAMLWPTLINRLPFLVHEQAGFLMPLLLLALALRRVRQEPLPVPDETESVPAV